MLIAGEGGPADPKRALSLLKGASDSWMAKGMLGQLTLEGKLVPRDIQEAVQPDRPRRLLGLRCPHAGRAVAR